jgi:hypothetical protein
LGILTHFVEPEDVPFLSKLEQDADLEVADEAHRALLALSSGGTP